MSIVATVVGIISLVICIISTVLFSLCNKILTKEDYWNDFRETAENSSLENLPDDVLATAVEKLMTILRYVAIVSGGIALGCVAIVITTI